GAVLEKRPPNRVSPFLIAAEKQNGDIMRLMLDVRRAGQELLDEAVVVTPIVQSNPVLPLLLAHGANINAERSRYGKSGPGPAWNAAVRVRQFGERDLLRLLIRYKVAPNVVVAGTHSPLMMVMHDHELMKGLLELGADVDYRNSQGESPLHYAVRMPREI